MKNKKLKSIFIIIPVVLVIAGMILFFLFNKNKSETLPMDFQGIQNQKEDVIEIPVEINEFLFYESLTKAKKIKYETVNQIKGGIAPHHDVASDLIADFFHQLSLNSNPKTFIILGPNHENIGLASAISEKAKWQTLFGIVEQDNIILQDLKDAGYITFDQENFIKEHSIKVLTPFIKYYFPDAKIVPIIFTTEFNQYDLLANKLKKYIVEDKAVIISSIDFSHYLTTDEAETKDQITLEAINNRDYEFLSKFDSDYLDSPACLIILLKTMDLSKTGNIQILQHSNSGKIIGQDLQSSTSYFTMFFTE